MAEYKAGWTVLFVIIYFMCFSLIVSSVSNAGFSTDNNSLALYIDIKNRLIQEKFNYCDNPRYAYDSDNFTRYEVSVLNTNYIRCDWTEGIKSGAICNANPDCSWQNVTEGDIAGICIGWLGCTEKETCTGYLNVSSLNLTTDAPFGSFVKKANNFYPLNYWDDLEYQKALIEYGYSNITGLNFGYPIDPLSRPERSICRNPNVALNETACEYYQCTWTDNFKEEEEMSSPRNFVKAIGEIFTYSYDFDTGNEGVDNLLTFIFIFIPMLILTIAIIYAVVG